MNNPIVNIDPDERRVEAFATRYRHNRTGEEVNINDGIDATVMVEGADFDMAKLFAKYFDNQWLNSNYDVNQKYIGFYYQTRYGNTLDGVLNSFFDRGPNKRLMPTSDSDKMILLEVPYRKKRNCKRHNQKFKDSYQIN